MDSSKQEESAAMLQVAAEAFQAKNFELAAEIYLCQLKEGTYVGSKWDLLLKRANCLALGGKLNEALEIYREASRQEELGVLQLKTIVEFLMEQVMNDKGQGVTRQQTGNTLGFFSCPGCRGFLFDPVTLPCGHTFCKRCLEVERDCSSAQPCKQCKGRTDVPALTSRLRPNRVNVVLGNLLSKWVPTELKAFQLQQERGLLYKDKKMEAALIMYNETILLGNHLLYGNHSVSNSGLRAYEETLSDTEIACRPQPFWLKSQLKKIQALVNVGKMEEALREYLLYLTSNQEKTVNAKLERVNTGKKDGETMEEETCKKSLEITQSESFLEGDGKPKSCFQSPVLPLSERCSALKRKCSDQSSGVPCKIRKQVITPSASLALEYRVPVELVDASDLECSLCMRLFYEPVTTPCGHTFCLKCLERCLDHNPQCPLCKEDLSEYLVQRKYCRTVLLEELIAKYLPDELHDRKKIYEDEVAELSNLNKNVPIFVCTMAYPTVPCPLHIFEPRYRLMVRRCMETGTKQFGMCISDPVKGFADYGCMLEVRNVEFFADGRSVVNSIGKRRFKVRAHGQRDGYNTADIEYLEDKKVEGDEYAELLSLHDSVYAQAYSWFNSLMQLLKNRILSHFGAMPPKDSDPQENADGPAWCWWLLAVLPLENRAQLPFLAMTSLKDRLKGIRRVLNFMSQTRAR
ncbi:LON peptidase N-terminal domain and RING finger protein 3 [Protopterus annectens]|uniref:LON peptidase N-terminal domain and RING finger protein 3 n=1 Tax=Protopterus annectens TaxID=7888 RepID=UPI001CF9A02B|nr:LON peptidase N-terminal domain and RING finger protein 3 [Protopterus annectens]